MTAAESKTRTPSGTPHNTVPVFQPAPFWRKLALLGTAIGIKVQGPHLRIAVARVRPFGASNPAAFTVRDFRTRPAAEWRAEYQRELKQQGVSDVSATVMLPRSEVIVRVAQFPGVADKDMASALTLELDTLHPYGDEPVNWAWSRIAPPGSSGPRSGAVLIGIVRSATLERYELLFREAGIKVSTITFSAAAVHAALRLYSIPPGELLAWVGNAEDGGEVYGESHSRTLFSAETGASIPAALAMGAAELRLPDNAQALPLDSILPRPDKTPAGAEPVDTLAWAAALAGAASWIARPANLLPPERRESVSRGRLIPTFVLGACVLTVVIALALHKDFAERQYLKQLNQQIAQLQPRAARSSAVDKRIAITKSRIELLDRFRVRTKDDIDIINELTRLLPPPVWIVSLEIHPDHVMIAGEADSAAPLLKALDSSPLFRNSEFGMAVARNGANETFRIKTLRRKAQ
jgi:Tfp pilus assembly protein PilN